MYAIVDIAGQQFKVEAGKKIYVHRLNEEAGASVSFDKVLLTDNDGSVQIGTPYVSGVAVKATILEHVKGNKVIVFKKKRRQNYRRKNGHRQNITIVKITDLCN